ncbi:hypothetical protein [Geobacter sp.]|uniref:hypothetical protein n=1 Tax=Geobacter sp. TaxID=46610 RepID=UPI00261D4CB3|nr:hypothetical protein [Geobacter sp.]
MGLHPYQVKPKGMYDVLYGLIGACEAFKPEIYDDRKGVPTIGYGTALLVKSGTKWQLRTGEGRKAEDKLYRLFTDVGKVDIARPIFQNDVEKLKKIATALNTSGQKKASELIAQYGDSFKLTVNEDQAEAIRQYTIEEYMGHVQSALDSTKRKNKPWPGQRETFNKLRASYDLAALVSIAYNGPALLTDELVGYIVRGERQDAFVYIAYFMRANMLEGQKGYVTRSYMEGETFSWFDGETPTKEETDKLEKVYQENKEFIDEYDKEHRAKLKSEVRGYHPMSELISLARQGKIRRVVPVKVFRKSGTSHPQDSCSKCHRTAHATLLDDPEAFEQVALRYIRESHPADGDLGNAWAVVQLRYGPLFDEDEEWLWDA